MHTSPDDFWSEFVPVVPRRWISSVACYVQDNNDGTDASREGPNENGMKRGAWKSTVDMML